LRDRDHRSGANDIDVTVEVPFCHLIVTEQIGSDVQCESDREISL
jgi:hypothetical protein